VPVGHIESLLPERFKVVVGLAEINVGKVYPSVKVGIEEIKPTIMRWHLFEKVGILLDLGIYRILKGEIAEIFGEWLKRFFREIYPRVGSWLRGVDRITTAVPKEGEEDKTKKYTEFMHYRRRILFAKMQLILGKKVMSLGY
jgi:hypothetical protein